jgi:hypothetical protein
VRHDLSGKFSYQHCTIAATLAKAFDNAKESILLNQHGAVRMYITNRPEYSQQVETDDCFAVVSETVDDAFEERRRFGHSKGNWG